MKKECKNCEFWEWNAIQSNVRPELGRCLSEIPFHPFNDQKLGLTGYYFCCKEWKKANGGD